MCFRALLGLQLITGAPCTVWALIIPEEGWGAAVGATTEDGAARPGAVLCPCSTSAGTGL